MNLGRKLEALSISDDDRLESIDRLIETEIGGRSILTRELEKLNSCLLAKKNQPKRPILKEFETEDEFESNNTSECHPRSMVSTHGNLTVTDLYEKERRQQLKKCLKPINQTLLLMGNQDSRQFMNHRRPV